MSRKLLPLLLVTLMAILAVPVTAQDNVPSVAIIRFGPLRPFELSQKGTLDLLAAYGYVDGENIALTFGDAQLDFPTANALIEEALNNSVDVIITITTPVTQAALNATQDMEEPPIILFNTVTAPYASGIAQAPCLKPDHVWGSQALPNYEGILPLVWEVNPDIHRLGWIYTTTEANGVASTEIASDLAPDLGLELVIRSITDTTEVGVAAEAIAGEGVDAFYIPTDSTVGNGLPAILAVAEEYGIPVFFADSSQAYAGVTVAAGLSYYQEGVDTARVLIEYLNGDIDIATTGISKQPGTRIGINLDSAAAQDVEIPQALLDKADFIIQNGESNEVEPELPNMSMEDMMAGDMAFVDNLFCSEERIAEQQAALESRS